MELGGAPNTWKPFSNSFAKIKVAHGHFFDKKNQQNAHELQNYQNLTILKSRKRRQECSGIFFFLATFFSKITTRPSTSFGTIILEINGHES